MKKIIFLTFLLFSFYNSKSETWIDIGVKGGYTPGVLINPRIFGNATQSLKYNHGYLYGGKIGLNFGLEKALCVDLLYTNTKQTLHNSATNLDKDLTFTSLDLPITIRANQENGGYGEIGPMFSFTRTAISSNLGDVTSRFNNTNFGLTAGFGQYIGGGNLFGLTIGFKLAYTFGDLLGPIYKDNFSNPIYNPYTAEEDALDYKSNSRLYAGIVLEFNFNLGYFTRGSRCAKRTRFKMF